MKDDFQYNPSNSAIVTDLMNDEIAALEARADYLTEMQDRMLGNYDREE